MVYVDPLRTVDSSDLAYMQQAFSGRSWNVCIQVRFGLWTASYRNPWPTSNYDSHAADNSIAVFAGRRHGAIPVQLLQHHRARMLQYRGDGVHVHQHLLLPVQRWWGWISRGLQEQGAMFIWLRPQVLLQPTTAACVQCFKRLRLYATEPGHHPCPLSVCARSQRVLELLSFQDCYIKTSLFLYSICSKILDRDFHNAWLFTEQLYLSSSPIPFLMAFPTRLWCSFFICGVAPLSVCSSGKLCTDW